MRAGVTVPPGGLAWRSFHYKPADPLGVSARDLRRVRRLLCRYDPRLGLFWSPWAELNRWPDLPGRWRIVEWMAGLSNWGTVFYLTGPAGEYRAPWPIEPHLERIKRGDKSIVEADREIDGSNERVERTRQAKLREVLVEYMQDFYARFGPEAYRQTFSNHGRLRSRAAMRLDPKAFKNDNHRKWLLQMGLISDHVPNRRQRRAARRR